MIGKFHLPISAGGTTDPFPASEGWSQLLSFQTNSPNTTTFDPAITSTSGQFGWDLGDGTIIYWDKSLSHTYADATTKTVKLYGKSTPIITQVDFSSDNIVGNLNLSNSAFAYLSNISLNSNSLLTGILFPSLFYGSINTLSAYSCNITGVLDLSMVTSISASSNIQIYSNSNLTGVTFANSVTGTLSSLYIYSCNITGTLDLSMFTMLTATCYFKLSTNSNLTGVTFANSVTGTLSGLEVSNCNITGTLNLSMFSSFGTSTYLLLNGNSLMTAISFASSITGTIATLSIYLTGIVGTLDLSKFTSFTTTAALNLYSNPSMTGITFASSITGTFSTISIYSTGIVGTLDLSKFTTFTAAAIVNLYSNTSMTSVTFSSSTITGFIRTLRLDGNVSLGYIDITKLRTGLNSLNWNLKDNGWTTAVVNQVLVNCNTISLSGFTGRIINVGGTNADPDSTSGGYDGISARNSLIAKGFTVTIT